jgi:hypothetical protein
MMREEGWREVGEVREFWKLRKFKGKFPTQLICEKKSDVKNQ